MDSAMEKAFSGIDEDDLEKAYAVLVKIRENTNNGFK